VSHDHPRQSRTTRLAALPSRWRCLSSSVVHSTPWFDVRQDDVLRPDGSSGVYQRVVSPGSVTILALDDNDEVAMTRQWIYIHDSSQWRLPSGGIDPVDDNPLDAAKRELKEETGLTAGAWASIGKINCADSLTNHVDYLFVATGLCPGAPNLEPGEADLQVVRIPFDAAVSLVMNGYVPDAGSAHALLTLAARRAGLGRAGY
jgi:8-oxo-dGTP pyrophosphatase MutT (NUDIX family)